MTPSLFSQQLTETIAWVTPRINVADPRWSLRSDELKPPAEFELPGNPGFFNSTKYISHVAATRSRLMEGANRNTARSGRLLLVDYETSNHNEATELESNGFFDFADNPPWDLWVGELQGKLVAWIPNCFIETVERSILVECMGMLAWAGDSDGQMSHPAWLSL